MAPKRRNIRGPLIGDLSFSAWVAFGEPDCENISSVFCLLPEIILLYFINHYAKLNGDERKILMSP